VVRKEDRPDVVGMDADLVYVSLLAALGLACADRQGSEGETGEASETGTGTGPRPRRARPAMVMVMATP